MTKRIFVILLTAIFLCQLASFGAPEKPEIINGDFEDSKVFYRFLDTLPLSFTTAQAMEVGRSMGISPRTIYCYLDVEKFGAFIKKKSHGRYEKKI